MIDIITLLYKVNKHSLALPCHDKATEEVVHRNMRMGIGMTGVMQCTEEQLSWLDSAYLYLRLLDIEYSAKQGLPISIKLSTTKPSGTLSLLPGVTPGVHPAIAKYMIRRIRISSNNSLVDTCRKHGYPIEYQRNFDGTDDRTTIVVEFPFSYPENAVLAKDTTAIKQLEWIERMQTEWSDNSVSCTVYYKKEELPEIREYLNKKYNKTFKTLSFLLASDHGFDQAPYEEITKEEFDLRVHNSKMITSIEDELEFSEQDECAGGQCPIR